MQIGSLFSGFFRLAAFYTAGVDLLSFLRELSLQLGESRGLAGGLSAASSNQSWVIDLLKLAVLRARRLRVGGCQWPLAPGGFGFLPAVAFGLKRGDSVETELVDE